MRLRAVEQRPALSRGHWPTRYAVVRAAVQRKWTKTVVSASGGSMGRIRREQSGMRLLLRTNRVQPMHQVQAGVDDATGLSIDSLMRSAHAKRGPCYSGALCPHAVLQELLQRK